MILAFSRGSMTPEFFDFANKNRVGAVGLVETSFGFHVVKVTDKQDLVLLANVSKAVVPSEKTSNRVFREATQFEMDAGKEEFATVAERDSYTLRNVDNVYALDENLPGLPQQRRIVQWAFSEDTSVGDIKRFNLSYGGYAIVQVIDSRPEGLASAKEVAAEVTQIILKEKKAKKIFEDNSNETSLEDLAASNATEIVNALAVNQKSGTLVGAGYEPYVVGAAFGLQEGEMSKLIEGNRGVYKLQLTSKKVADELEDYSTYAKQLSNQNLERLAPAIIKALESSGEVVDNRSLYY